MDRTTCRRVLGWFSHPSGEMHWGVKQKAHQAWVNSSDSLFRVQGTVASQSARSGLTLQQPHRVNADRVPETRHPSAGTREVWAGCSAHS